MFKKTKSIISLLLSVMIVFGLVPLGAPAITYAAQDNEYVDPADVWMQANGRTNEFDINASITYETMPCTVCNMDTSFQVFRVPEYTKSGDTAYNRGVKYSDGTLESGSGTANLDEGIPGKNATYTGYHWNKSVCQNCGTINASSAIETYGHGKNVYMLSPCDNNFFLDFDSTTYEKYDEDCHTTTLKRGEYCQFCKGTYARAIEREDEHEFTEQIDPQIGNSRFFIKEVCEDCGYETSEYVTAKSVVASYYGVVDGQAHSVEITDISDRGVRTTVRYGETADDVRLSSPPAYTDAGYYSVYYNTTYSYGGENMEENGVAYVWLLPNDEAETQDAPGKPGDPDNPGDGTGAPGGPGSPSGGPGSGGIPHEHDYHYLETVPPTCGELGFERFQCKVCGALQKTNYTEATGHDYGSTEVREASCNQSGLTLYICKNCGDFYSETTPMTGHLYQTNNVLPTCKSVGYTEHTCLTCGQSYTDNILPIAAHNYDRITKAATCTEMGYTSYVCSVCGDTKVMDYEPAKGHDWDAGREVTNSTCVSAGVKEYRCEDCGITMTVSSDASGHTPGPAATCTQPQRCQVCGAILELPTGHKYSDEVTKPTCTSDGYTTHTCDNCGDHYIDGRIPAAGHKYESKVTAPTCTKMGYVTYTCSMCGDKYTDDFIDPVAHRYKAIVTPPTCTTMGFTTYTCMDCEAGYVTDYVQPTEHNYKKQVTPPTCESVGYTVYTCPDCGKEYIGDLTDAKEHHYNSAVTPPTCTKPGYTTYTCSDCGYSYKDDFTDKLDHKYYPTVTEPTCESSGYTVYKCANCDATYTADYTDKKPHDFYEVKTEPTCSSLGFTTFTCKNCDFSYMSDYVDKKPHNYLKKEIAPTCTEMGYTLYTCGVCGDEYKSDYVDKKPHNYYPTVVPATCQASGYTLYTCADCQATYKDDYNDKLEHNYYTLVTEPTCTEMGYTRYICRVCDYSYDGSYTDALGHSYTTVVTEPTCTEHGYTTYTCERCGSSYQGDETATISHDYEETVVPPTCTELGYTIFKCKVCGETYQGNEVAMLPHAYTETVTEPTCSSMGFTTYNCSVCGDTYDGSYTDPLPHDYEETIVPPTCSELGYTIFKCKVCGETHHDNEVATIPHTFDEAVTEPTCSAMGYTTYTCSMCGFSYKGQYTDMLPHVYEKTVTEPTCTALGYTTYTCSVCGHSYKADETAMLPHDYDEAVTEPTCTALGYTTYTCKDCGEEHRGNYIEPAGHKLSGWIIDTPATIEQEGSKHIECLFCGEILLTETLPQLIDVNNSDEDGESEVGDYTVVLTDKEDDTPIFNSEISIDVNDNITVKLPSGRLLDYEDRTVITVFRTETLAPVPELQIFVYDENNNAATGVTDGFGQLTVPNGQSSTGDGNGTVGGETPDDMFTYVVTVTDREGVIITDCGIAVDDNTGIVVTLPDGVPMDYINRVTVTVTDQNGEPAQDVEVTVIGSDTTEHGATNIYGKITLPDANRGITDGEGHVSVNAYIVTVEDEAGAIPDAFVTYTGEGRITVEMPQDKRFGCDNRVTVTVLVAEDGSPIPDMDVIVTDFGGGIGRALTDENGRMTVPPLNEDRTDSDGKALVDGYEVTVADESAVIENAFIVYRDGEITVTLPVGNMLSVENRVTVTVTKDGEPVSGMTVNVLDNTGASETDLTDEAGQVVVPPVNEDYTDKNGQAQVSELIVLVSDEESFISDAFVKFNEDGSIDIKLPDGRAISHKNRITVTVLNKDLTPVEGKTVSVADAEAALSGVTDAKGQLTVPPMSEDYTGDDGKGEVTKLTVVVNDEAGLIPDAFVVFNEDGSISVTLPEGKTVSYDNRTTVTVYDENMAPAAGKSVTVTDGSTKAGGITDMAGQITVPSLDKDVTDKDGKGSVTEKGESKNGEETLTSYDITVENKSGEVADAFIEVKDGKIYITLPETCTLTTSNQTTVTVTRDGKAVKGVSVTVTDKNNKTVTKSTNSSGKITVPVKSSGGGGGGSSGGSSGGSGGNYYGITNVTVVDKDGIRVYPTQSVKGNDITLTLPYGTNLDGKNYYTVTVTDGSGLAKAAMNVTLTDRDGKTAKGITDKNGRVVLPKAEHEAYILGYPDGSFGIDDNMTRAQAAAIFARILAERKDERISGKLTSFADVPADEWYAGYVSYLEDYGVIRGYEDGTFKPDANITRSEFVVMCARLYALTGELPDGKANRFSDVKSSYWAYDEIRSAVAMDWIKGYTDSSFRGDNLITRSEAVTVVNRVTGRRADEDYINANIAKLGRFNDLRDKSYWAYYEIIEAANAHDAAIVDSVEAWIE